jgi:hypothetical protein
MQHRTASSIAYIFSVVAATAAASLMSTAARAEGPIEVLPPFVGTLTRAEVKAQLLNSGASSYAIEWKQQQGDPVPTGTLTTRKQVTDEFIASRDQVRAMNGEDSGSSLMARMPARAPVTVLATGGQH